MSKSIVFFSTVLVFLFSFSYATPGIFVSSACYRGTQEGVMIAAASDTLWDNGRVCGKMFTVKCSGPRNAVPHPCTGKSVKVKIVDHCPSGCASTLDFLEKLLLRSLILSLGLLTLIIFRPKRQ
ncbi:putative rlpA-like protein, double-psi beta-barrel [Arabidopsis thaliana]